MRISHSELLNLHENKKHRLGAGASEREATAGFEPAIRVLQTRALPLGYVAID